MRLREGGEREWIGSTRREAAWGGNSREVPRRVRMGGGRERVGVAPSIVCWLRVRDLHRAFHGVLWAGAGVGVGVGVGFFLCFVSVVVICLVEAVKGSRSFFFKLFQPFEVV